MINKKTISIVLLLIFQNCSDKTTMKNNLTNDTNTGVSKAKTATDHSVKLPETEEEWKSKLTDEEFDVLRNKGTERPYSGKYTSFNDEGIYVCKGCGTELFRSDAKFDSRCGWPSFYEGIDKSKITETADNSLGMKRIEVTCARCGGHLGHVFDDGPKDKTGLRYCINSVSLGFIPKKDYDSTGTKR